MDSSTRSNAFTLPPLPYAYDALEPYIDKATMELHHYKHHGTNVNNLNGAVAHVTYKGESIEQLLFVSDLLPTTIRNNGEGHYNHSLFWQLLSPRGAKQPGGILDIAIRHFFDSFDYFKDEFTKAATNRFGSGWAWLVVTDRLLSIISTTNRDKPLMQVAEVKGITIIGLEVSGHAYYLKYQNKGADYI